MQRKYRTEAQRRKARRSASAKWRAKNRFYAGKYYAAHKLKLKLRSKIWRETHAKQYRKYLRDWNARRRKQIVGNKVRCPICRQRMDRPYIDHCHTTAKKHCRHNPMRHCKRCQRGVICPSCNWILGLAKDNIPTLKRAQRYIADWAKTLRRRTT